MQSRPCQPADVFLTSARPSLFIELPCLIILIGFICLSVLWHQSLLLFYGICLLAACSLQELGLSPAAGLLYKHTKHKYREEAMFYRAFYHHSDTRWRYGIYLFIYLSGLSNYTCESRLTPDTLTDTSPCGSQSTVNWLRSQVLRSLMVSFQDWVWFFFFFNFCSFILIAAFCNLQLWPLTCFYPNEINNFNCYINHQQPYLRLLGLPYSCGRKTI